MSFRLLTIVCTMLLFVSPGCDSEEEEEEEGPPVDECEYELDTDVVTDHLALYLPLNEDLNDHSGNCRHAESTLDLTFVDGKLGGAVRLDGLTSYFTISEESSPLEATKFTVIMLVELAEVVQDGDKAYFWCWDKACLAHEWVPSSAGRFPGLSYGGGRLTLPYEGYFSDWTMLVVEGVKNRLNYRYYHAKPGDSGQFSETNLSGSVGERTDGYSMVFGSKDASPDENPDRMEGTIDEIRVYHKLLTKVELNELFEEYFGEPR